VGRRRIPLLIALLVSGAGAAGPQPPVRLSMQWTQGENIHIGSQEGAINRRGDVRISVELLDGNRLRAEDRGKYAEHNLFRNYSTNEETEWANRWSGTWTRTKDGDSLRIDLRLEDRKCKKTKTASGVAPEKLPCEAVSPKIRMECSSVQIEVEGWTGAPSAPVRKTEKVAAWSCTPADSADFADTPSRWVFGKSVCLKVSGGRGPRVYSRCSP
jgi:hypothetical protein